MPIINQIVKGGGGSSVAEPYINWSVSNGQLVSTANHIMDFSGITTLNVGMANAYKGNTTISGAVDMSDIEYMLTDNLLYGQCKGMFENCTGITSVDLSGLKTIGQRYCLNSMFKGCTGIISANLSSLTSVTNQYGMSSMFYGCTSLTDCNLDSLEALSLNGAFEAFFSGCTSMTTYGFKSLKTISAQSVLTSCFRDCTSLQSLYFYALTPSSFGSYTNQFTNMLTGVTGCTVHFPMAVQSTIGSWTSVTGGFSGTNTTVLFDIVTTLTGADSNSYTRKQKESTSTATAWTYNDTLYYTSGTTEPAVSDTIYSDAACTTAVTTISAIA